MELHIDIYSIGLIIVTFFFFLFLLSRQIKRIKDKELQAELDKILKKYALGVVDEGWIIWAPIFTVFYSFYIILKLCLKKQLGRLIKTFWNDKLLVLTVTFLISFWIVLTLFALLHWFLIYAIAFIVGLATYISLHKKRTLKEIIK